MAKVEFLGPLSRPSIEVNINNLEDLKVFFIDDLELQNWLAICAVAVNDTLVFSLDMQIQTNDKISLLPPVCGG